jgi:tetratricopeptide (TPR) repeat protein
MSRKVNGFGRVGVWMRMIVFWGGLAVGGLPQGGAVEKSAREVLSDAERLLDEGRWEAARQVWKGLERIRGEEALVLAFLEARALGLEGRTAAAEKGFLEVMGAAGASDALWVRTLLALAESQRARGSLREALQSLSQGLASERALEVRDGLFRKYVEFLRTLPEGAEGELREWSRAAKLEQRGAARFYLGWLSHERGQVDRAMEEWGQFLRECPGHRLSGEASARICGWMLERGDFSGGVAVAREALRGASGSVWAGPLRLRLAAGLFRQGQTEEARVEFLNVVESHPELRLVALFNAGLAAVRLGREREVADLVGQLRRETGGDALATELEAEGILAQLRLGVEGAEERVLFFENQNPGSPRLGALRLALAEWGFERSQAVAGAEDRRLWVERCREWLAGARLQISGEWSVARADYLGFLLGLEGDEPGGRMELGEEFLRKHPQSPLGLEVRMRLGEASLRNRDFSGAEIRFATVERLEPGGRLAERALFLAGNSAAELLNPGSVDRALGYWNRVVEGQGELKWEARYQQAAVKSRLGGEEEALVLFDLILEASPAVKPELRWRAWCGKADALWSLDRRSANGESRALGEYRALAAAQGVPAYWRNQALYKAAKGVERRDSRAAFEEFSRVLEAPGSREEGEFFWRFKAGFEAAGILEREKRWSEAVALYERMAAESGPGSEEARRRAQRLRLECFLWE